MILQEKHQSGISDKKENPHHEVNELRGLVNKCCAQNAKLYAAIVSREASFAHSLYKPKNHTGSSLCFLKELLLKQIDQLMEEKELLIRKKQKLDFKASEVLSQQEKEVCKNSKHYSILRSAWTKFSDQNNSASEKLDDLNKIVAMLKCNVKALTSTNAPLEVESVYFPQSASDQLHHEKRRQQMERLLMRNQELETAYYELMHKYQEKQKKVKQLSEQLQNAGNQIKKSLDALCGSSEKLRAMEQSKKRLEETISKLKEHCYSYEGEDKSEIFCISIDTANSVKGSLKKTGRRLQEIIQFLERGEEEGTSREQNKVNEIMMPWLNLTLETARPKGETERHAASNAHKFIPLKSQRSQCNKSSNFKTTNGSQGAAEDPNTFSPFPNKKFIRRGDQPLTTGRKNVHPYIHLNMQDSA